MLRVVFLKLRTSSGGFVTKHAISKNKIILNPEIVLLLYGGVYYNTCPLLKYLLWSFL